MNYSSQNYENVARYMDGQSVLLDVTELNLLDEVRNDMLAVGKALDATVDSDVIDRVLARHRKSAWRSFTGFAAAAAVVLVAVSVWILTSKNATEKPAAVQTAATAGTNEVVETLATVQSIIDAQQELDIITMLVQNESSTTEQTATTTKDDTWDMSAWAKDLAS